MTELLTQSAIAAASLQLYRKILSTPVGAAWWDCCRMLAELLDTGELSERSLKTPSLSLSDRVQVLEQYACWYYLLAQTGLSWPDWLVREVLVDDNPFSRLAAAQPLETIPVALRSAAAQDLKRLHCLCRSAGALVAGVEALALEPLALVPVLAADVASGVALQDELAIAIARLMQQADDWEHCLELLADRYRQMGVGLFGRYRAARWQGGALVGVHQADAIALDEIYGYARQKAALCGNVEALIAGQPALNVLLYGARGTGKSSLVKSLLTQYGDRGLRIVELSRSDLRDLLVVVDQLAQLPQSFILFIDDLSFSADETDYKQLKVMLEGDIAARPTNVCLYATSNRRHLVKEYLADRPNPADDEVHAWDTVQEKLSLSDRFGLTLTFPPFSQADYFATVYHLAELRGIERSREELRQWSLTWAQQQNGFSGRTARQFIDRLQGQNGNVDLLARGF
ncbi:MAG: ATP-binding protein [Cyanobacteria bacterium J06597_1]